MSASDIDSAQIRPDALNTYAKIASILKTYDKTVVHVVGHTDSSGSAEHNQGLSERRAASVASYSRGRACLPAVYARKAAASASCCSCAPATVVKGSAQPSRRYHHQAVWSRVRSRRPRRRRRRIWAAKRCRNAVQQRSHGASCLLREWKLCSNT